MQSEPLRESAQRALVQAYLAEGNCIEARRCLSRYATLLREELGVPPSAELVRLAQAVRVQAPRPALARVPTQA